VIAILKYLLDMRTPGGAGEKAVPSPSTESFPAGPEDSVPDEALSESQQPHQRRLAL
jgi:hypothetical protein